MTGVTSEQAVGILSLAAKRGFLKDNRWVEGYELALLHFEC